MPEPSVLELMIGVSIGMGTGHAIVIGHLSAAVGWIAFGYLVFELTASRIPVEEPCSYKKRRSLRITTHKTKLTKKKKTTATTCAVAAKDPRPPFFTTSPVTNVLSSTEFEDSEFPWTVVRGRRRWYSDC